MVIELSGVQFWSEIKLVIANRSYRFAVGFQAAFVRADTLGS